MLNPIHVLGYTAFYSTVHLAVERFLIPRIDAKLVKALNRNDRIDLPEKLPSSINGLITGLLGLYVVFGQAAFRHDVITPYPPILDVLFGNYVGYTIYDLMIMYTKPKEDISMWIHHLVGLVGANLMPIFQKGALFPVLFTITEVTVIPGNMVWVLQRLEKKETQLYEFGLALRALAFTIFRPLMAPFCFYYAINNPGPLAPYAATFLEKYVDASGTLASNTLELLTWNEKLQVLQSNLSQIPRVVPILSLAFIVVLGFFNFVWFFVIVTNYFKHIISLSKKKKSTGASISGDKKLD